MNEIITVEEVAQLCKVKTGKAYKICLLYTSDAADEGMAV